MAELTKLRPDRDLQCYFQVPSTVAALSETSANGFTVSGCWRQQFDWVVIDWTRDNVFEHPALRKLPDGDLSGVRLSYEEVRTNCIPMDSTSYDRVDWSYLRVWQETGDPLEVPLRQYATPVGEYTQATAQFQLTGAPKTGDYIELAWLDQHFNYRMMGGDTLEVAAGKLAEVIHDNRDSGLVDAAASGSTITLTYKGAVGSNGNRIGVYGTVCDPEGHAATEVWSPAWSQFSGGVSPSKWRVELDFGNLHDRFGGKVPTANVRKLRWTWAADAQAGDFVRSEFSVVVNNWQVSGSGLVYSVAGPGSRRIEDTDLMFSSDWKEERGNYSGGSIRVTSVKGKSVGCTYRAGQAHWLYLGTRYLAPAGKITVVVDGVAVLTEWDLTRGGEDVLVRVPLGQFAGNVEHSVTVTHAGDDGTPMYFDFLEIAVPTTELPVIPVWPTTTLATDWDTDHSLALAPERTAWLIDRLGFKGRANHYVGAMWFYELRNPGQRYASATVTFAGPVPFGNNDVTTITLAGGDIPHFNLIGDTPESIAKCFELLINAGAATLWAQAMGPVLTITSRLMGRQGNRITLAATGSGAEVSTPALTGGVDGTWVTDLQALPRLNRAVRDWSRSYFRALRGYGIDVAAAFSTELRHGDDSPDAGIAQRYPGGPVWVNTPALQTNFSPASLAFWKQIYLDMGTVMAEAGVAPYLQFGEVQWWYKPDDGTGMPFWDEYTKRRFRDAYQEEIGTIASQWADPAQYPQECELLPALIGEFTDAIMAFVRQSLSNTRFEVLYPPDVNDTPLNQIINYPRGSWTAAKLNCLKTENFTYTGDRKLDKAREAIGLPKALGFPAEKVSHLVGILDYTTPWDWERKLALGARMESVVLFALDQFCLMGTKLGRAQGRSLSRG